MSKNIRNYLIIALTLVVCISLYLIVEKINDPLPDNDSKLEHEEVAPSITNTASTDIEDIPSVLPYKTLNVPIQMATLKNNFVAPSFMSEKTIIFSLDDNNTEKSQIVEYDLTTSKNSIRYTAPSGKTVTSLVATSRELIWVEYDLKQIVDMTWEMKKMGITTGNEVVLMKKGESKDQLNPPLIRVLGEQASWIEKRLENKIVYSEAFLYDSLSGESKVVTTNSLNEQKPIREGIFLDVHRQVKDGLLIQQTEFTKDGSKTFNLEYYSFNGSVSKTLVTDSAHLVDFTADDKWLVLTEVGKVSVIARGSGEVKYVIKNTDEKVTNDSPYLVKNHLLFRSFTEQIIDIDLDTGEKKPLSEPRSITSKLFNSSDFIGASYMDVIKNDGSAEFMIFY
jgi:hypothetical protein